MKELLREVLCLAIASVVGWWFFLRPTAEVSGVARIHARPALSMEVTPLLAAPDTGGVDAQASAPASAPPDRRLEDFELPDEVDADEPVAAEELESDDERRAEELASAGARREEPLAEPSAPPPPELGTPEGSPDARGATAPAPGSVTEPAEVAGPTAEESAAALEQASDAPETSDTTPSATGTTSDGSRAAAAPEVAQLMRDPELLAAAGTELSGEERRGFATVLLATPEDQLAIARFFGEELVLVPRETLDPRAEDPRWFRIAPDTGRVEELRGHPPLESFRQYRDLFDYEYARLPDELRALRRTLAARGDIYLFAALLPAREWAVVVARRAEALTQAGRELSDVRSVVLRYRALAEGAFDLAVDHLVFVDGSRYPVTGDVPGHGEGDRAR